MEKKRVKKCSPQQHIAEKASHEEHYRADILSPLVRPLIVEKQQ